MESSRSYRHILTSLLKVNVLSGSVLFCVVFCSILQTRNIIKLFFLKRLIAQHKLVFLLHHLLFLRITLSSLMKWHWAWETGKRMNVCLTSSQALDLWACPDSRPSTPLICFSSGDLWPRGRQGRMHASDWLRERSLYLTLTGSRPEPAGICLRLPPLLMPRVSCCLLVFVLWFIKAGNGGSLQGLSGGHVVVSVVFCGMWKRDISMCSYRRVIAQHTVKSGFVFTVKHTTLMLYFLMMYDGLYSQNWALEFDEFLKYITL